MSTSTPVVQVTALRKAYSVPEREPGLKAAFRSLVRRKSREVKAVDGISFAIAPGEIVASSLDRGANTITISFARTPGDDVYCGTAAASDFRFSTRVPITTQAAFDAA